MHVYGVSEIWVTSRNRWVMKNDTFTALTTIPRLINWNSVDLFLAVLLNFLCLLKLLIIFFLSKEVFHHRLQSITLCNHVENMTEHSMSTCGLIKKVITSDVNCLTIAVVDHSQQLLNGVCECSLLSLQQGAVERRAAQVTLQLTDQSTLSVQKLLKLLLFAL